ncbi:MAG: thiamine-phosphate kinase [Thermodesulfovibrionales bacterium]|nr:thiamine-phosphate kinase [Thermodesulfovibrionales bacterium]
MKLHQIGELSLLKEVRKRFSSENSNIIIGIGDDAAVLAPQGEKILVTTDMMNEGVHFDLNFIPPFHLGFKLVSINVSDIMAMGGKSRYLLLDIAMKKDADEEFFWELFRGVSDAINMYGMSLLGGDLCAARNDMVISATVIGTGDRIVRRGGASVGDKIYVTGTLGDSACGFALLQRLTDESREKVRSSELGTESVFLTHNSELITLNWNIAEPLLMRHLMPIARDSAEMAKHATSMIDISDGLFIDLFRICDESNVGAKVYLNKIPISDEMRRTAEIMKLDPFHLAVSGGEDYELLFTMPPDCELQVENCELRLTCIGEIIERDRIVVDENGMEQPMKAEGYQHFGSAR